MLDAAAYKRAAELRITNNLGSSFWEPYAVTLQLFTGVVLGDALTILLRVRGPLGRFLVEFFCMCFVSFASVSTRTESDDYKVIATTVAVTVALVFVASRSKSSSADKKAPSPAGPTAPSETVKVPPPTKNFSPFFTNFRGGLMFLTCLCILCVDFPIFPKRMMKTETFGVSLMDTGVGLFVFSAAAAFGGKLAERKDEEATFSRQWLGSALPLFVLGGVRSGIIFITNYQEHLAEYGKHWNFFCTLGMLPVLYLVLNHIVRRVKWILPARWQPTIQAPRMQAAALGVAYQVLLTTWGSQYIQSPHRRTLFEANKEGILSSLGYMCIFLAGVDVGRFALPHRPTAGGRASVGAHLVIVAVCLQAWAVATDFLVEPCSRRMCNLSFVLYIIAFSTGFLGLHILVHTLFRERHEETARPPLLMKAINTNQLFVFLVANLTTGAINLTMYTIYTPPLSSYGVVAAYMLWICGIAVVMERMKWRVKVW